MIKSLNPKERWKLNLGAVLAFLTLAVLAPGMAAGADYYLYLPLVTRAYPTSTPFGITMYGAVNNTSNGLTLMKEAGCKWVITFLEWKIVEPNPPTPEGVHSYDWSFIDTKIDRIQAAGMKPYILFTGNPEWTTPEGSAYYPAGPVKNLADLLAISRAMAQRYNCDGLEDAPGSPCVDYWSFYPEPDNIKEYFASLGWGFWGNRGREYAAMLKEVAQIIHEVNPKAKVMPGGIAYDYFDPPGPFSRDFLPDILSAFNLLGGTKSFIDGVAFHYYPLLFNSIQDKSNEIRSILELHGAGDLPLHSPEVGYWSSPKWGSSEADQAQRLIQIFTQGLASRVTPIFWFRIFDKVEAESEADTSRDLTTGLLRVDGTPKPAYYAYKTAAGELAGAVLSKHLDFPNAKGYSFSMPGGQEKMVVWPVAEATDIELPYPGVQVVNQIGNRTLYTQDLTGLTTIPLPAKSAIFLQPQP